MCACARQASAEDPENNGSLLEDTPESERGGERAQSQEDYTRADFIKLEGGQWRDGGGEGRERLKKKRCRNVEGGMEGGRDMEGEIEGQNTRRSGWTEEVELEGGGLESQRELTVE